MVKLSRMNGKGSTAKTYVSYTGTEIEVIRYNRPEKMQLTRTAFAAPGHLNNFSNTKSYSRSTEHNTATLLALAEIMFRKCNPSV